MFLGVTPKIRPAFLVVTDGDEVLTGVVRRVNVDHFELTEVVLAEEFESFEVVALNVEVLGGFWVF